MGGDETPLRHQLGKDYAFGMEKVSDSTFLIHLGGKITMDLKVPLRNRTDLARAIRVAPPALSMARLSLLVLCLCLASPLATIFSLYDE